MEEPEEKIVQFDSYDTVMQANLVKTKLDAYGIPCFLTDEHFVGLYPIRNELFPGVRLYVFENDIARVKEILADQIEAEKETLQCPNCTSHRVIPSINTAGTIARLLSTLFVSPFLEQKNGYRCQDCSRLFYSVKY